MLFRSYTRARTHTRLTHTHGSHTHTAHTHMHTHGSHARTHAHTAYTRLTRTHTRLKHMACTRTRLTYTAHTHGLHTHSLHTWLTHVHARTRLTHTQPARARGGRPPFKGGQSPGTLRADAGNTGALKPGPFPAGPAVSGGHFYRPLSCVGESSNFYSGSV